MENNYKPNSHKYKEGQKSEENRKKVEKVVNGTAKIKKKKHNKFAEMFISEDVENVKSYILSDILVPAAKKLVSDIVKDGIEMILYGESNKNRRSNGFRADYISYNRYSDRRYDDRYSNDYRERNERRYDEIILESRGEAEEVLDRMDELIETYGYVSVADLYDLVGITGQYTDNKYGWTYIGNAKTVRIGDGYLLKLSTPRLLPNN